MTFATNHLGPFAFTEALVPHLPDGANVVFVASAVEDSEHKPAKVTGFRGGRYLSVEASARGEWKPGGSKMPGADAYATSKQCNLATVMTFARETPRLRFNAVEPSVNLTTGLARCQRLRALSVEIHHSAARAAAHALHEVLEHPEASRTRDHQRPDRYIRIDLCLLRRERLADAWLRARARSDVPGSRRCRDAQTARPSSYVERSRRQNNGSHQPQIETLRPHHDGDLGR